MTLVNWSRWMLATMAVSATGTFLFIGPMTLDCHFWRDFTASWLDLRLSRGTQNRSAMAKRGTWQSSSSCADTGIVESELNWRLKCGAVVQVDGRSESWRKIPPLAASGNRALPNSPTPRRIPANSWRKVSPGIVSPSTRAGSYFCESVRLRLKNRDNALVDRSQMAAYFRNGASWQRAPELNRHCSREPPIFAAKASRVRVLDFWDPQLLTSGQIAHRPIPASAAALYPSSECIVGNTEVTLAAQSSAKNK